MRISDWSSDVCSSDLQLKLGSAVVDADITLYDQPRIVADIQLAQTHVRSVDIAVGRVKVDYRNGSGPLSALNGGPSGSAATSALPRSGRASAISQPRSDEHTSELQSLMRTSYDVFCLK